MRILMAAGVPRRREGGVAAIIYNLGEELKCRGHEISYFFYEDCFPGGSRFHRFRDLEFSAALAARIRKNRKGWDVVNLHAPSGCVYGVVRRMVHSKNLPPYVLTLHGLEERRFYALTREAKKGRAWHFSRKNRLWHHVYHRPRFYLSIKTADRLHCYSRDVWTMLQLKYDIDPDRLGYIPNGVEERFFIDRKYDDSQVMKLLYAGSWLDQRGIYYLRDALLQLSKSQARWTLTVAGPGVEPSEIEAFFGSSLLDRILIRPLVPAHEMPKLYADHDIFVFPSLMEGLPGVLLEAMASGMPVITTETCGMPDVVRDGLNGILIPPADAQAMEASLLSLCRSPGMRRRLGVAAQETMRRYSWSRSAEKLEQLFVAALEGTAAREGPS